MEFKECPFCNGEWITIWEEKFLHGCDMYTVKCCYCGAMGGSRPTKEEAIEMWNTRSKTKPILTEEDREFYEHWNRDER